LGYWVLAQGTFNSPEELRALLNDMIDKHMPSGLRLDTLIRLRPDLQWESNGNEIYIRSQWIKITLRDQPYSQSFGDLLATEWHTVEEIMGRGEREFGLPMAETFTLLSNLFVKGLLDEDPANVQRREAAQALVNIH
jgi:hypothetical protein